MEQAIRLADAALEAGELPIAAILVLDDEIVASAHTSEVEDGRFLVHAELKVLLEADCRQLAFQDRRKAQIFTTLEPCMMCLGACMSFFLGEVYYALESPGDGATELAKTWHRKDGDIPGYLLPTIEGGVLREEARALFEVYVERHSSGPMWEWAKTLSVL